MMTPTATILIPTLNERNFIKNCLASLLKDNFCEIENIEILVIDGGSTDGTQDIVKTYSNKHPKIRLIKNPKKITPAAMNIGMENARGEIILWCGAHAEYQPDYVKNSIEILLETECASVGGVISPIAKTRWGQAIAIATMSKFGIGNATYRYATSRQNVDTVFGGCFLKKNALKVGGFNEKWVRNQDYEFNYRLRQSIGEILLDPTIKCRYYCRETLPQLIKQYFAYGYWRFNTLRQHPTSFSARQAAPLALVTGLFFSMVAIFNGQLFGAFIPAIYIVATALATIKLYIARKQKQLLVKLPVIFVSLHLSWGLGFFWNALTSLSRRSRG